MFKKSTSFILTIVLLITSMPMNVWAETIDESLIIQDNEDFSDGGLMPETEYSSVDDMGDESDISENVQIDDFN